MEEVINQSTEQEKVYGCKNCLSPLVEEGYAVELCAECRDKLSKRPLPIWVKAFFVFILSMVIIALTRFPTALSAGIIFEKGLSAEKATKYITASKEYEKAMSIYPDSMLIRARLFIAYSKSGKIEQAQNVYSLIAGKQVSDDALLDDINRAADEFSAQYFHSDELTQILNNEENANLETAFKNFKAYSEKNPQDLLGHLYLGSAYFDMGKYKEAEEEYLKVSAINPDLEISHLTLASVYRQTGRFDKAMEECNKVLEKNIESISAYISMAKIELKRHNYSKALETAEKAYNLDNENLDAVNALAIAFHYNNMGKERDDLFNILKQNNYYDIDTTKAIFEGKSSLFN